MTVETILDQAQEVLHDDGSIWTRSELLEWLNDAYRQILAQSHACVRPFQHDVPGRLAFAGTQEWEERHARGLYRNVAKIVRSARMGATFQWEAEQLEGLTPTTSNNAICQPWERAFLGGDVDDHFQFVLSKAHERPLRVYWDDKQLVGASSKELDTRETSWHNEGGEPIFWFPAIGGKPQTYELYEIVTSYNQEYQLTDGDVGGIPRSHTGDRTYSVDQSSSLDRWDFAYSGSADLDRLVGLGFRFTRQASDSDLTFVTFVWEEELVESSTAIDDDDTLTDATTIFTHAWEAAYDSNATQLFLGVGLGRSYSSADRQYVPAPYHTGEFQLTGAIRDFKGSANSLTIFEIIVPTRALTESDVPSLLPVRMAKYLKYYVLAKAFSRKGSGFRPDLAQAFAQLYQLGAAFLTKIGNPTFLDKNYSRDEFISTRDGRPPRVRFPSTFERVW